MLIYILGPSVIFFAIFSIEINLQLVFLPLFVFFFGSSIAFYILKRYKKDWNDASINTLVFTLKEDLDKKYLKVACFLSLFFGQLQFC